MVILNQDSIDTGHAWLVMVAALIQNMLCSGMFLSSSVYMLDWMDIYQASTTQVATVASLLLASGCISGMAVGILVDKYGPRPVSLFGGMLCMVALIATSLAPQFWMIYITFGVLLGCGESFASIPPVLCVQYYFEKKRPLASGLSLIGHSLGSMLMLPLLRILISNFGLRGAMVLHAGIVAHIFVTSSVYWPVTTMKWVKNRTKKPNMNKTCNIDGTKPTEGTTENPSSCNGTSNINAEHHNKELVMGNTFCHFLKKHVDFDLLKYTPFVLFLVGNVLDEYCMSIMTSMTPIKANKSMGVDLLRAAFLTSLIGTFSTVCRLISSFVVNLQCVNRTIYLGVSMVMMGVVTAASCIAWNFFTLSVAMACFGLCIGAHFTVMFTVLTDTIGLDRIGQGIGFIHFFLALSAFTQLSFAGWLIDQFHNYDLPYYIYGGIQVVAGIFILSILCVKKDLPNGQENVELQAYRNVDVT